MTQDCVFCRIVAGEAPAQIVYQDDLVTAFWDIRPVAPVHILIAPNAHYRSLNEMGPEEEAVAGRMMLVARQIAQEQGIADRGYRLILNTGRDAGQVVFHVHLHLLGGRRMRYPLG